ncbi:MAG: rRNA ((1402)-2-O)-methyltransferase [Actinomycetia bacterium]|nr:rRNA ((1402)-2-O)-methyltransferase [Actinomycetes bacterium]
MTDAEPPVAGTTGRLVLVGTPIGNLGDLSPRAVEALRAADVLAAEDTRRTRKLLSHEGIPAAGRLIAIHEHNERDSALEVVALVRAGKTVVYVSDAGMPVVSDPGERLVAACVDAGLSIEVVPGPSAVLTALALSGLPAARFTFEGFLPRKGRERAERLAAIADGDCTVVMFESPHRVPATVDDLLEVCGGERRVALARELTKLHEETWRGTLTDAAEHVRRVPPRGEYVLVIGPAPVVDAPVDDDAIVGALQRELAGGASGRDAAASVARLLGVPKRRAYDLAISLRS